MKDRIVLLSILFLFCLNAFSQDSIKLNAIIARSVEVADARPIEKVYLHFDKPYYAIGDTIWFKGYLTVGLHQPSGLSKVIYVDVISSRDSLVKTFILPVSKGAATGSIALSKPLFKEDSYRIKAYTKWMLNTEQDYFFNKTISVGNAATKEVRTITSFKRSEDNNLQQITANIIFKDGEGEPYANKKATWAIAEGFKDMGGGKGTTDKSGLLTINYGNSKSTNLSKAILTVTLEAGRNKVFEKTFPLKSVAAPSDVQFFPEGGNLIQGIPTKVAVKAIQSNGLGIDFTATITDDAGNTITSCNSQHAGMGVFIITPQVGKTYKADINFKDGSKGIYNLPKVQTEGFTLSINNTDTSKVVVKLLADSAYLKRHVGETYYLLGKSGQIVCYAAQTSLRNIAHTASVLSSKFPTGIVQFTLLSSSGQPISERIVFIRHQDQLSLSLNTDKKSYSPRERIQLDLLVKNGMAPAEADFSVAVIDESKIPVDENTETTILSSLLLTSDLKGYIENPNYYFNKISAKTEADLDLLMLTQGYRRYVYQDMLSGNINQVLYLPEQGIEVTGTLRTLNGMPFKGGRLTLQIPDRYFTTETVSDTEGRFKFSNLVFTDSALVVVSAKNNINSKNLMLMLDQPAYPEIDKNPNYPDEQLNIDTVMNGYLQYVRKAAENSRVLQEVTIVSKVAATARPSYKDHSSLAGLSQINSRLIPGDRLKDCNSMLACIQSMALGTTYDMNTNLFYVTRDFNAGSRVPMAIFIAGMPSDVAQVVSLSPEEIESVEVFLRDDLGLVNRTYNTNGVIVVNIKSNVTPPVGASKISLAQLKDMLPESSVIKLKPAGYTVSKQFYSPKYTVGNNNFGPDLRSTIYWNPGVSADASGKASVEFYSADSRGIYRAVVEGIDKDGHIGYSVYRFKIE